jgi:hypothetical protein
MLEALYEAISYRNTLEKCVKLPVEGVKGVIVVRGLFSAPPINRRILVIDRTHHNKRRALKGLLFSYCSVLSTWSSLLQ